MINNELLKNFADKAAEFSAIMAIPTGRLGNELFVERLAELIIKECGILSDQYQFEKNNPSPLSIKPLPLIPSEFIYKYFGIEE